MINEFSTSKTDSGVPKSNENDPDTNKTKELRVPTTAKLVVGPVVGERLTLGHIYQKLAMQNMCLFRTNNTC
jgi:hypothetical protein